MEAQDTETHTSFTKQAYQDDSFRNYVDSPFQKRVEENYRQNHTKQTLDFVISCKEKYKTLDILKMTIWEAIDLLNELTDDSDPDTDVPQISHAIQTAEAARAAFPEEKYDWLHLTALIHDLGKVLAHPRFGSNPQWAVVGDTFPVGCTYSDKVVFHRFFRDNPDASDRVLSTTLGRYSPNCGFDNVHMSWGHDEYMYLVCKGNQMKLPDEALYIIRYHSFYAWHKEGAYEYLANDRDREMLPWLKTFSTFDLYTKHQSAPSPDILLYYKKLIEKYLGTDLLRF
jgi:inositol oxygenase